MQPKPSIPAGSYTKMAIKAMLSITLFLVVYFFILLVATTFMFGTCLLGGFLVMQNLDGQGLVIGLAIIAVGLFFFYFVIRFAFKPREFSTAGWIEIKEAQERKLFQLIREVAESTCMPFPNAIYLCAEANAQVFLEPRKLWMFLPSRKNLVIGMALIEALSEAELRAVVAHEFGHFSQKSMRIGSFVYYVHRIIYYLVFEDATYGGLLPDGYVAGTDYGFFVNNTVRVMRAIQWLLAQAYRVVALNYAGLSREMEFHADAVAASVTHPQYVGSSLLKLPLLDDAFAATLDFHNREATDMALVRNIYPRYRFVLDFLIQEFELPIEGKHLQVPVEFLGHFNKSKLEIGKQWESHPRIKDRIQAIGYVPHEVGVDESKPARELIFNLEVLQIKATKTLVSTSEGKAVKPQFEEAEFQEAFVDDYRKQFPGPQFRGYYDQGGPMEFDLEIARQQPVDEVIGLRTLFSPEKIALTYTRSALNWDLKVLGDIADRKVRLLSFDYDGRKYPWKASRTLVPQLQAELSQIEPAIRAHDNLIYRWLRSIAIEQGAEERLDAEYRAYFAIRNQSDATWQTFLDIQHAIQFLFQPIDEDKVEGQIDALAGPENRFKAALSSLLRSNDKLSFLPKETKDAFKLYLSKSWQYVKSDMPAGKPIEMLCDALNVFEHAFFRQSLCAKQHLVRFQASLLDR